MFSLALYKVREILASDWSLIPISPTSPLAHLFRVPVHPSLNPITKKNCTHKNQKSIPAYSNVHPLPHLRLFSMQLALGNFRQRYFISEPELAWSEENSTWSKFGPHVRCLVIKWQLYGIYGTWGESDHLAFDTEREEQWGDLLGNFCYVSNKSQLSSRSRCKMEW